MPKVAPEVRSMANTVDLDRLLDEKAKAKTSKMEAGLKALAKIEVGVQTGKRNSTEEFLPTITSDLKKARGQIRDLRRPMLIPCSEVPLESPPLPPSPFTEYGLQLCRVERRLVCLSEVRELWPCFSWPEWRVP